MADYQSIHTGEKIDEGITKILSGEVANQAAQAEQSAKNAKASANKSQASADDSVNQKLLAESYAHGGTGTRPGEDTDNAKYYKERAQAIVGPTVTSFKGRQGNVIPQKGDYTADMVDAVRLIDGKADPTQLPEMNYIKEPTVPGKEGQIAVFNADGTIRAETLVNRAVTGA